MGVAVSIGIQETFMLYFLMPSPIFFLRLGCGFALLSKSFEKFASNQSKFCFAVQRVMLDKLDHYDKWLFYQSSYNQLQKWWDTPTEKRLFLLQIAPGHRSLKYNTDLPPPSHSKLFLQVLSMVLYC